MMRDKSIPDASMESLGHLSDIPRRLSNQLGGHQALTQRLEILLDHLSGNGDKGSLNEATSEDAHEGSARRRFDPR